MACEYPNHCRFSNLTSYSMTSIFHLAITGAWISIPSYDVLAGPGSSLLSNELIPVQQVVGCRANRICFRCGLGLRRKLFSGHMLVELASRSDEKHKIVNWHRSLPHPVQNSEDSFRPSPEVFSGVFSEIAKPDPNAIAMQPTLIHPKSDLAIDMVQTSSAHEPTKSGTAGPTPRSNTTVFPLATPLPNFSLNSSNRPPSTWYTLSRCSSLSTRLFTFATCSRLAASSKTLPMLHSALKKSSACASLAVVVAASASTCT